VIDGRRKLTIFVSIAQVSILAQLGVTWPLSPIAKMPLFFCLPFSCACAKAPQRCANRVVQFPISVKMELFWSGVERKGWCVRALQDIPPGTFVCSYAGELLSDEKADLVRPILGLSTFK
jgi:hypothetical protein